MEVQAGNAAAEPRGFVARVIEVWALLGGFVLLGIVLMVAWSATRGYFFNRPLQGDVEMTEMWVAVAAFMPFTEKRSIGESRTPLAQTFDK